MQNKLFTILGENIADPVLMFIRNYNKDAFESNYNGGFLRMYEDYSYLNSSYITVCLRVDTSEISSNKIVVEVITGGASGSKFFDRLFGTEKRRIGDFEERLQLLCEQKGFTLEMK